MPKITIEDRNSSRSYEGDFVAAVLVSTDDQSGMTARVVHSPLVVETGMGFFVGGVEFLQMVAGCGADGPHVDAARKALEVIDENDPTKQCPLCGRRPRKDSDKALWTPEHVLVACERCTAKMSRSDLQRVLAARS